jgi:succinyl-CoA synthetase beta subunit
MMLLEHDAKELLAEFGLPVPSGRLLRAGEAPIGNGPAVVKAQVPVGGRGKAGGIRLVRDRDQLDGALAAILGMTIKGHEVRACRVEEPVDFVAEAYLSFTLDAATGTIRVLMSQHGGVEVEDESTRADLLAASADPDPDSLRNTVAALADGLPTTLRAPVCDAGLALAAPFFATEAVLLEINPLFIRADGSWVIGDTKLSIDENAFPRAPRLQKIIEDNADLYPEAALKLEQGFDYVLLDPQGDIGLVTTGAGLSMQLIDELTARGRRPYNFCDIRTGQFKGDPARLIQVLQWIAAGPSIRSVLINFFAGHTDLAEIARLLVIALEAVPELKAPITARFIGNGLEAAIAIIVEAGNPIAIETDLERAIDLALQQADAGEPANV